MGAAVGLRGDYEAGQLRGLAKRSQDAAQTATVAGAGGRSTRAGREPRRLRSAAADGVQTVRDWALAFNAEGPDGLDRQR